MGKIKPGVSLIVAAMIYGIITIANKGIIYYIIRLRIEDGLF